MPLFHASQSAQHGEDTVTWQVEVERQRAPQPSRHHIGCGNSVEVRRTIFGIATNPQSLLLRYLAVVRSIMRDR